MGYESLTLMTSSFVKCSVKILGVKDFYSLSLRNFKGKHKGYPYHF